MRERSVYSINQRRRLEAETTHEREERLQQLSDNQQRKLDTETTAHARPIMHSILLVSYVARAVEGLGRPGYRYRMSPGMSLISCELRMRTGT